jgi:hypothetical protein
MPWDTTAETCHGLTSVVERLGGTVEVRQGISVDCGCLQVAVSCLMVETPNLVGVGGLFVRFRRFLCVLGLGSEPSLFVEQGLRFLCESVTLALLGFGHGRHGWVAPTW